MIDTPAALNRFHRQTYQQSSMWRRTANITMAELIDLRQRCQGDDNRYQHKAQQMMLETIDEAIGKLEESSER
jgi:hypothetical protein